MEVILKNWDDLPNNMKNEDVREYYNILRNKKTSLILKRIFDIFVSIIVLIILLPVFIVISIIIKIDSKGPILFMQVRVTQYGKLFKIFKFRTMVDNADKLGSQVTTTGDVRITKVGNLLRKLRLDEIPQLLNIITGDMTFVGTRPEVVKYADKYTNPMIATLLLPAGVTSETSIKYKDEEKLLKSAEDADETYINEVLPEKMKYNLQAIKDFSFMNDIVVLLKTVVAVFSRSEE